MAIEASFSDDPPLLEIIHLSDLHFGKNHRFQADPDSRGVAPRDPGHPSLFEKLAEDLAAYEKEYHETSEHSPDVAVCITGDITETGSIEEFKLAEEFIKKLADCEFFGKKIGIDRIVCVPGNHDLKYNEDDVASRWTEFADFHNRLFGTRYQRANPHEFVSLARQGASQKSALFLCMNSAAYVKKDDVEATRGRLDQKQLKKIDELLKAENPVQLKRCIKVALMHHHPVLVPDLVEPGSNYDAIYDSGLLLNKLRSNGFHLVLHGHKHFPVTFSEDTRSAYSKLDAAPMIVASGGSVGSRALPSAQSPLNSYNRISVRWDSVADQYRIRIVTRGMNTWDVNGRPELASLWNWKTLAIDERVHLGPSRLPQAGKAKAYRRSQSELDALKSARQKQYLDSRGWFPVAEVVPSLIPKVHYEARVWLVMHPNSEHKSDVPERVTWYAGPKFQTRIVEGQDDNKFCVMFHYYGPMLVLAELEFRDGQNVQRYIYIRRPENYVSDTVTK